MVARRIFARRDCGIGPLAFGAPALAAAAAAAPIRHLTEVRSYDALCSCFAGALPAPRSAIESTGHWAEARCKCKRCRSVHVKRLLILSRALWCKLAVLEHVDTSRSICRSRRWLCCATSPRHPAVFAFAQLAKNAFFCRSAFV